MCTRRIATIPRSRWRRRTHDSDRSEAHGVSPETPLAETLAAFDALIKSGKVRAIGASNYTAPRFAEALAVSAANGLARFETLQPLYNLVARTEFEGALRDLCIAGSIGVINYYALAAGFLTGKYRR